MLWQLPSVNPYSLVIICIIWSQSMVSITTCYFFLMKLQPIHHSGFMQTFSSNPEPLIPPRTLWNTASSVHLTPSDWDATSPSTISPTDSTILWISSVLGGCQFSHFETLHALKSHLEFHTTVGLNESEYIYCM